MYFKKVIFCLSLIVIILSISSISASENIDVDESVECYSSQLSINEVSEIENLSDYSESDVNSILLNSNNDDEIEDCEIFVGPNENDGDGSEENPYKTFDLACENVKNKNNVTINVFNGTYYLGSTLKFNCTNLHIKGLGENVIIKNQYNEIGSLKKDGSKQAFSLTSLTGTFKISNIIFDSSEWTQSNNIVPNNDMRTTYYYIFYNYLGNNTVIVNDCKFKQSRQIVPSMLVSLNSVPYNMHNTTFNFNNCIFEYVKNNIQKSEFSWSSNAYVNVTYCLFKFTKTTGLGNDHYKIYNSWFGENVLPDNVKGEINRYAIFSISEEKIDDNTYDIIGKLMWNDSTADGIENLAPMTVTLTSATGEIPATATLENGIFKVRYTTTSKEHSITAKLDSQELNLAFNYNVDINAEAKPIYYGEDQNITINLPYDVTGVIKLIFEDETSEDIEIAEISSFNYTIKKTLKAGVNQINISLIDDNTHSYGSTILNYEVLKLQTTVNETTFVDETPASSDKPTFTINLPEDATGNFTVTINGKNYTKELVNGSATIVIEDLPKGEYNATLTYSGDDKYDSIIKNTTASVKEVIKQTSSSNKDSKTPSNKVVKKTTKITAKKKTFKAKKKIKKYAITLKSGKKPVKKVKVTLKIKGKTYKATTNAKGKATFKIKNLKKKGKYTAVIKFKGNKNYKATSKKVKITIKK